VRLKDLVRSISKIVRQHKFQAIGTRKCVRKRVLDGVLLTLLKKRIASKRITMEEESVFVINAIKMSSL